MLACLAAVMSSSDLHLGVLLRFCMSDFALSNGLVNDEVAFRLVVTAGIVISVLLAVGLHFSILQETVKQSFSVSFLKTYKPK
jgi:hypothetical protein